MYMYVHIMYILYSILFIHMYILYSILYISIQGIRYLTPSTQVTFCKEHLLGMQCLCGEMHGTGNKLLEDINSR